MLGGALLGRLGTWGLSALLFKGPKGPGRDGGGGAPLPAGLWPADILRGAVGLGGGDLQWSAERQARKVLNSSIFIKFVSAFYHAEHPVVVAEIHQLVTFCLCPTRPDTCASHQTGTSHDEPTFIKQTVAPRKGTLNRDLYEWAMASIYLISEDSSPEILLNGVWSLAHSLAWWMKPCLRRVGVTRPVTCGSRSVQCVAMSCPQEEAVEWR